MSSEINVSSSTCDYTSLGRYNDGSTLPNTLGNIAVRYPVAPGYQIVPYFACTGDYSRPNYNSLCKGSCFNYAGINQAYTDCSNPLSSQGCALNGGQCVTYRARPCQQDLAPAFSFRPMPGNSAQADYQQMPDNNKGFFTRNYGAMGSKFPQPGSKSAYLAVPPQGY